INDDFVLPPGVLVFPPGVSSKTIPIVTVNDNIAEGPETFTITLMNPTPPAQLGPFSSQVFTLDDNDFGGTVGFGNTSVTAGAGRAVRAHGLRRRRGHGGDHHRAAYQWPRRLLGGVGGHRRHRHRRL